MKQKLHIAPPVAQYTPICKDSGGITLKFRKEEHLFVCQTHHPDLILSELWHVQECQLYKISVKHNQRALTQ